MFLVWTSTDQCTNNHIKHLHWLNMNCELNFQQSALVYFEFESKKSWITDRTCSNGCLNTHTHIYREQGAGAGRRIQAQTQIWSHVCSTCDFWQISLSIYSRAEGSNEILWPFSTAGHSPPHAENSKKVKKVCYINFG